MPEEAEALLKHLGFTEYESKAYMALLKYGTLTAEKISSYAKIPLPRVYDTMTSLSSKGLIFVSKTRPQTFRAVEPKKILEILREDEKKKMSSRIKGLEDVVPQFLRVVEKIPKKEEPQAEEVFAYIKRRINMEQLWYDLHQSARKEVLMFAGDLTWVNKTLPLLKKMKSKGVKYKILFCKKTPAAVTNVKKVKRLGIELVYNPDVDILRGVVIDGSKLSIVQTDSKEKGEPEYTTTMMNNKIVTHVFLNYFNSLWKHGTKVDRFLKKYSK